MGGVGEVLEGKVSGGVVGGICIGAIGRCGHRSDH